VYWRRSSPSPTRVLYDLGSSLGAVTQALRRHVQAEDCRVIAVDNSPAMVGRCREYLHAQDSMFQELLPVEVRGRPISSR
jgi:tRNA (cmo5U34)-methyltransferase